MAGRTGKTGTDIFARPTTTANSAPAAAPKKAGTDRAETPSAPPGARAMGRPKKHTEGITKATVALYDRQIEQLDTLRAHIRLNTGASVERAEILRALVDAALSDAKIDLTRASSEADVRRVVAARMRAK